MSSTTAKRTLSDTDISSVPSTKKRKLNEDSKPESSLVTVPLTTESPSMNPSAQPQSSINGSQTNITMSPPTTNPSISDINIKNDNTAKSDTNSKETNPNKNPLKWKFKQLDFTFGDNSWVKQSSNVSNISDKSNTKGEIIPNDDTTNSFAEFEGLGFQKVLDEQNNKKDNKTESDSKDESTDKKEKDNPWNFGDSNADGTFKLNFDWGNWENGNNKIDLNPSTSVGWESQAKKFDPNEIEVNTETKKLVEEMGGEQDAGDGGDDTKYSLRCKVYNLEGGKYIEKGIGTVKLNMYGSDDKKKARILCRREQIFSTIINALVLKEMKFEKINSFIRFGVVVDESNQEVNKEGDDDDENEDDDLKVKTCVKTFLVKPMDKTQIDVLLKNIKDVQEQVTN